MKLLAISTKHLARQPAENLQFNTASINFVQEMYTLNLKTVVAIFFTIENNQLRVIIEVDTYKITQDTAEKIKVFI